jgi:feruloyl esterase
MTDFQSPPRAVSRKSVERVRATARRFAIASLWTVSLCAPLATLASPARVGCAALSSLDLGHVDVVAAYKIVRGEFVAPDESRHDVPGFCRVQGEARPTRDSQIRFELWMPANGWNGRYYQLGNGGFGGTIPYASMAGELRRGNAVAATDTGHAADAFDASWALGHPEKVIDYGWRSLKETSDAARALVRGYYGANADRRYFVGCSNGGRQALLLAQRFPADWDGVMAGAPALNWTRQLATFAWNQQAVRSDPESWIDPDTLAVIQRLAIASCTPAARVVDGVPTDPRHCQFDPAAHKCKGEQTAHCLTSKQAAALSQIQHGPADPRTGAPLYFGFEATAAAVPENWDQWIVNADPSARSQRTLSEQFFRHMVFADANWRIEQFDASRDFDLAQRTQVVAGESLESVLNASNDDLAAFARRGARLLMYVGWADALISPRAAIAYYEAIVARMGGLEPTQRFFRLFMAPGMTHCQGGPGPHIFGQSALTPGVVDDAAHDARRALEAWVEQGHAPLRLVAAKYVNDDPAQGLAKTRVLCAFPNTEGCSLGGP